MEEKVKLLIAVGAAVAANCIPCLKTAVDQVRDSGIEKKEILEAIQIGRLIRRGANGKMDQFTSTLTGNNVSGAEEKCPFGVTDEKFAEWVSQDDQCGCS